eukprot:scaffold148728_cov21-Tisochrysis_lutea.AAC.2
MKGGRGADSCDSGRHAGLHACVGPQHSSCFLLQDSFWGWHCRIAHSDPAFPRAPFFATSFVLRVLHVLLRPLSCSSAEGSVEVRLSAPAEVHPTSLHAAVIKEAWAQMLFGE